MIDVPKHKIFEAEYPYECTICGKRHNEGTRSLFSDDGKGISAADCKWPKKANATNSKGSHKMPEAADTVAAASAKNRRYTIVESNADYAISITCQKFKKTPEQLTEAQMAFATELAHQFYGLQYLEEGDKR